MCFDPLHWLVLVAPDFCPDFGPCDRPNLLEAHPPSLRLVYGFGPRGWPIVLELCAWFLPLARVRVIGRFCWNGITPRCPSLRLIGRSVWYCIAFVASAFFSFPGFGPWPWSMRSADFSGTEFILVIPGFAPAFGPCDRPIFL